MAYFGVDTQVRIEELNHNFGNALRQRGHGSVHKLREVFKKHDFNSNGKLEFSEFEEAMSAFG